MSPRPDSTSPTHTAEIDALLGRLAAYATARGISVSRVATLVLGNGTEFTRIEGGGDIGSRKILRANRKLDALEKAAAAAEAAP